MYSLRFKYRCVILSVSYASPLFALYHVHSLIRCNELLFFYTYFQADSFFNLPFVRWFVYQTKPGFGKLIVCLEPTISKSSIDSAKWDKVGVGSRVIFKQRNLIVQFLWIYVHVQLRIRVYIVERFHNISVTLTEGSTNRGIKSDETRKTEMKATQKAHIKGSV